MCNSCAIWCREKMLLNKHINKRKRTIIRLENPCKRIEGKKSILTNINLLLETFNSCAKVFIWVILNEWGWKRHILNVKESGDFNFSGSIIMRKKYSHDFFSVDPNIALEKMSELNNRNWIAYTDQLATISICLKMKSIKIQLVLLLFSESFFLKCTIDSKQLSLYVITLQFFSVKIAFFHI